MESVRSIRNVLSPFTFAKRASRAAALFALVCALPLALGSPTRAQLPMECTGASTVTEPYLYVSEWGVRDC